ncbi:MAG: SpoIIE family protein phosphatase, partial [Acidobacteria bacterium]|nr:SpoIIE family protein phosphatase [Acidobacteriota bacterium]
MQRRLCGPRSLHVADYELASEIFPVRHLSGDFITCLQLDGDLVFAVGDIAGKGPMAAMWFTYVVGLLRRSMFALGDPAAALAAMAEDLLAASIEIPLTSLFLARLELASGALTYASAGHPPALLLRQDHQLQELSLGGPLLGIPSPTRFQNGRALIHPGDTLIAYS